MPLLLEGGLSLRARLSWSATVSKECCFNIISYFAQKQDLGKDLEMPLILIKANGAGRMFICPD
jgi:hypothetical protein